jgi:signal transduction histidine kinase
MTSALSAQAPPHLPLDPVQLFDHRVSDWSDPYGVATTAVAILTEQLLQPSAYVYRTAPAALELVLLACGRARSGEAVGARRQVGKGALGQALRDGKVQKVLNSYVEPDFVRSLPGETRSEVAVPITGDDGVVGVVHLVYTGGNRPQDADVELAEKVALRLAPALSGGAGDARGGDDELRAVADSLASALAGTDDLPRALALVADGALRLTGAGGAMLLFRHNSRQALELAASAGRIPPLADGLITMEGTIPGEVARSGRSRAWSRAADAEARFGAGAAEQEILNALVVPLTSAGKTFGVLAVVNRLEGDDYAPAAVERLQLLAHHAAALEPMRQIGPLRRMLSDNSLIAEVGRAVTGTLGLDEVLGLVVRAAEMLIGSRGVALGLISEDGDRLHLAAASGALRSTQGQTVPIQGTLIGSCVATASQVVSPCVSDDPRGFVHETRQGPGVVVPLESRARIWGALMVTRAEGAPAPSDVDIDALRKLAGYASIAIDNAHLYREQTELSTALRAQTEELTRAYAELRESQERLVVSEKMAALGRITAGIAHEINSPLGGILNCLQLASSYAGEYESSIGDPEVTSEDHAAIAHDLLEAIRMAEAATRKVAQFVRTIKGQTRTGEDTVHAAFDVAEEIDGVVTLLGHELRNRNVLVKTEVEPGLTLIGDRGKFSLILQNLVNNAIDAYEGAEGEVWVRMRQSGESLVLAVADEGCGIPEAIRPRIYDYLFTTKDVGKGTGLGLSIVHSIVTSNFNGDISVESEPEVGTTFTIRFPSPPPTE